jgi:addiction module HigA family antidote
VIITEVLIMNVINNGTVLRKPTHPGEMLREGFLPDYALTISKLADAIGVSRQSINELSRERRAVNPAMALKLGRLFGNAPEFWLNSQRTIDLWKASQVVKADFQRIKPLDVA